MSYTIFKLKEGIVKIVDNTDKRTKVVSHEKWDIFLTEFKPQEAAHRIFTQKED